MPEAEVRRWCDVHVAVFKESLNQQGPPESIPGRPVHTFRMENRAVGQLMEKPRSTLATLVDGRGLESGREPMKGQLKQLSAIDKQYLRKENQLFPLLERRGVQDPPKVMWGVHDQRTCSRKTGRWRRVTTPAPCGPGPGHLLDAMADIFYKEENVCPP